jgi:predicted CXXCH cytochrome family protein
MLTFFFDGVPAPDSTRNDTIDNSALADNNLSNQVNATPTVFAEYIVHYPYQEKECTSCHDENSKSELIAKQPELCYSCHDDFTSKYKYIHGPVAAGYCTSCHNPHMSKQQKLLTRAGQDVCLFCHDSKSVYKNEVHKDIADAVCTECHNPHGGEDRFILN